MYSFFTLFSLCLLALAPDSSYLFTFTDFQWNLPERHLHKWNIIWKFQRFCKKYINIDVGNGLIHPQSLFFTLDNVFIYNFWIFCNAA